MFKSNYLAIIAALLIFSSLFFNVISYAEESSISTSESFSTESSSTPEISPTSTPIDPPGQSSSTTTQELTPASNIEKPPTPEATSTPNTPTPELTAVFTPEASSAPEASSTPESTPEPTPPPPIPEPEIVKVPQRYLSFSLEGSPIKTEKDLPWFPEKFKTGENKENTEINIGISGGDSSKIVLSGACSKNYFVILVFAQPNDYVNNPGRFIYNKAFSCQNGGYSHEINDLSKDFPEGAYYFMVAEQGLSGPWQPITAIQPIRIRAGYK